MAENVVSDTLAVDRFVEKLSEYSEIQSQLGDRDRAIMASKAVRIINVLTAHCMNYNIGIPAQLINHISNEKV